MRGGRVAVFIRPGEPILFPEEEVKQPASDEILIRVSLAGVCGSDVHRLKGDVPAGEGGVCFGHEAVGVIEGLGSDIKADRAGTPLAEGDMLYWMPLAPCGTCEECVDGVANPLHCRNINWPPPSGTPNGAGFRQFATIKKNSVFIRVPSGVQPESVIAFGCALPTALRGFKQLGTIRPGADFVIQGSGPVGLACILLASLADARTVTVLGDPPHRLEVATSLGATRTISVTGTTPESRLEQIRSLTAGRGASIVIEAAGAAAAFPEGFDLLGMNGKFLILGLYSGKASGVIDPVRINNLNLQIIGSLGIDLDSFKKTVDIAAEQGTRLQFPSFITHRFSLDQLEEALLTVGSGAPIKAVIVPN
ncbi:hypothetical protein NM208_g3081 [Fusarium decemcellulare]|uniref:Uncharacterized protein n=1 Tax=Fusarium decemcellulare TaxID=57161 RepID=A0ACC1SQQ1_9HYPO|nr:hypothetical protein NM208_g3081 [Fusarium decemcellulare]